MRNFFRFGLLTLFAAMLLCISVAGWQRDRQRDAKEQAALDALAKENVSVRITRRSQAITPIESSSVPAVRQEESESWSSFAALNGKQDPIVTLMLEQIPSDAARKQVLDLPHLETLWIFGNVYPLEGKPYPAPPNSETIFGRSLPELPPAIAMPDEPPPLPRGTPLSEEERLPLLAEIDAAWKKPVEVVERGAELRFASSNDCEYPSILTARRGEGRFRLEETPCGGGARIHVIDEERGSVVQRRWETGAWRLEYAARSLDETPVQVHQNDISPDLLDDPLVRLCGREFSAEQSVEEAERLEDGGYLLKRRNGDSVLIERMAGGLDEGWIVVGPAPSFAILRGDAVIGSPYAGQRVSRTDMVEYDGKSMLPLRQSTWIRVTPTILGPGGTDLPEDLRKRQIRFAREVDPELPADLFEPTRYDGDFFTSEPLPSFRWWHITGALSLAAFAGIGAANVYGLAKRRSPRLPREK